jgi:membrane AbrB-like protein
LTAAGGRTAAPGGLAAPGADDDRPAADDAVARRQPLPVGAAEGPGEDLPEPPDALRRWAVLALCTLAGTVAGELLGVPTPSMIVGLLVGIVYAVRSPVRMEVPRRASVAAQAVGGVVVGAYVSVDALEGLSDSWLPVVAIVGVTLLLTFAAGVVLSRIADVDAPTATFGMIAGGAAGIVSIAKDLGADNRMVALMQYLRVVLILLLTPIIAGLAFEPGNGVPGGPPDDASGSLLQSLVFVAVAAPIGLWLARALKMTAPGFFGPMLVGVVLTVAGAPFAVSMPIWLPYLAYAVIGLEAGLDFTPETLRQARRILPAVLGMIVAMLAACAALGFVMAPLAGVSSLDGYLATTPGVLQVVLGTAIGMHANTTFVLSAQVLRLLMMLLAAPPVARRLARMGTPKRLTNDPEVAR